jgi:hypothetical protein
MGSGGVAPPFLTSALGGGEWSASCPGHFTPGERAPGTHCGLQIRSGLYGEEEILAPAGKRTPGLLASSTSLYRLSSRGSCGLYVSTDFHFCPVLPTSEFVFMYARFLICMGLHTGYVDGFPPRDPQLQEQDRYGIRN